MLLITAVTAVALAQASSVYSVSVSAASNIPNRFSTSTLVSEGVPRTMPSARGLRVRAALFATDRAHKNSERIWKTFGKASEEVGRWCARMQYVARRMDGYSRSQTVRLDQSRCTTTRLPVSVQTRQGKKRKIGKKNKIYLGLVQQRKRGSESSKYHRD